VAIIVCTFQRRHGLLRLLSSLERQRETTYPFRCIVVDNNPPGRDTSLEQETFPYPLTVIRAPEPGVGRARNAGLECALGDSNCRFVAFIDDDEVAAEDWLQKLLAAQQQTGAPVVTGPVLPVFEGCAPDWIESSGAFDRTRHPHLSRREVAYTGNVLLCASLLREPPRRFDETLARGEDSYFFRQVSRDRQAIVWADDAVVHEYYEPERLTVRWLLRREFSQGYGRTRQDLYFSPGLVTWVKSLVRALRRLVEGFIRLIVSPLSGSGRAIDALCLFTAGLGRMWGTLGLPYEIEY